LDSHSTGSISAPSPSITFAIIGLALLLHAFFTTAEIALITLRKTRLRQLVEENNPRAALVERLLHDPVRLMAITQIGTILTTTLTASVAVLSLVPPLAAWLLDRTQLMPFAAWGISLLCVLFPTAIVSLIIGEIAPRSLVGSRSDRLALRVARPVRFSQILLAPAVSFVTLISNLLLRPFGGEFPDAGCQ
jgi:putative hemolysin